MSMGMGLSLQLSHKMQLDQRIELSHKLELKMVQKLSQLVRDLSKEVEPEDQRLAAALDQTFASMSRALAPDQIAMMRGSLGAVVYDKEFLFLQKLLENSGAVLFEGRRGVEKLTAQVLGMTLKMRGDLDLGNLSEGTIANELSDPGETDKKIADYSGLIEALGVQKATENAIMALNEVKALKALGNSVRPHYEELVEFFDSILNFPAVAENPLRRALVDFYMLDQAAVLVSERLVKRFAAVFSRRRGDLTFEKLEVGVANIIGEYILVGMGVIDPEVFKLMSGKANYNEGDEIILNDEKRAEIGAVLDKYKLRNGKFFYNSYATLNVKPGLKADQLIRDFLTSDVRAVRKELCEAVDLQSLIDGFTTDLDSVQLEEARDNLMGSVGRALVASNFREMLVEIIKNRLLPKLIMTATGKRMLPR